MSAQIENILNQYKASPVVVQEREKVEIETSSKSKTETKVKTGSKSNWDLNEYSKYLQKKFNYFNKSISMNGVPVTVSVSPAFLTKCVSNSKDAEFLESNLSVIPECVQSAVRYTKTMKGSPVMTYMSYTIDANGNISCASGCTNDPDGKIARENAQKKVEEEKEAQGELKKRKDKIKKMEKIAEKKEQVEILKRNRETNDYTITVLGADIKGITRDIAFQITSMNISEFAVSGFDTKA